MLGSRGKRALRWKAVPQRRVTSQSAAVEAKANGSDSRSVPAVLLESYKSLPEYIGSVLLEHTLGRREEDRE